jgi:hypothetical protein
VGAVLGECEGGGLLVGQTQFWGRQKASGQIFYKYFGYEFLWNSTIYL